MKVSKLEGIDLDYWVAKALGYAASYSSEMLPPVQAMATIPPLPGFQVFEPSTDWGQGGPIIEREHIALHSDYCGTKFAEMNNGEIRFDGPESKGYLPLAMRCFVASKFGEEVEECQTRA